MKKPSVTSQIEESSLFDTDPGLIPLALQSDGRVLLVDQRKLPLSLEYFDATILDDMCTAIKDMVVRGAPSIGIAAAFAMAKEGERLSNSVSSMDELLSKLEIAKHTLDSTRPTAVNLSWATAQMMEFARHIKPAGEPITRVGEMFISKAKEMLFDHISINKALSDFGAELVSDKNRFMTHCNAGSLAACGWGTALGVIRSAHFRGLSPSVFVDETRPRNQGARLTMWELHRDGIPATLVCDSMSGHIMSSGNVDMVVVGADRIAANGDVANKIGTYNLAIVARHHAVPFYVAAPLSTFDLSIASGADIPIEFRDSREILAYEDLPLSIPDAAALNPAFDVTPASLISGIITERGVLRPDYVQSIKNAFSSEAVF